MEAAIGRAGWRGVWGRECGNGTAGRFKGIACQDRAADVGKRFFRKCAHQSGIAERKTMITADHKLSISRQVKLLKISRGSFYYVPIPVNTNDLALMRRM